MMHRIEVKLTHRWGTEASFTCDAGVGAKCRQICGASYEEWDEDDHEHTLVDSGECQLILFANEDESEIWERYTGADTAYRSGAVDLTYQGDGLIEWAYTDTTALAEGGVIPE